MQGTDMLADTSPGERSAKTPLDALRNRSSAPDLFHKILGDEVPLASFSALVSTMGLGQAPDATSMGRALAQKSTAITLLRDRLSSPQILSDSTIVAILLLMSSDVSEPAC